MKKSALTFYTIFMLLYGMISIVSDGTANISADSGSLSVAAPVNSPQAADTAFPNNTPNFTMFMLSGIGLIGLAGVSRRNNH